MNDTHKIAILALGLCAVSAFADESLPTRAEHKALHVAHVVADGVERGAKAAAHGVEVGAHAAVYGVKVGARAAAHGVEIGAAATARVAKRVERKVAPSAGA